jgi:hypothetical protein
MTNELSIEGRQALLNVPGNRQGTKVQNVSVAVQAELFLAGLIGKTQGLTRKGTIVRERLLDAVLNSAFE